MQTFGLKSFTALAPITRVAPKRGGRVAVVPSRLLAGVNLAGGEFGGNVPGVMGTDYFYVNNASIDYFINSGATVVRFPFYWERIQDGFSGPLRAADIAELDRVVTRITTQGAHIVLDPHNYFRWSYGNLGNKKFIGEPGGPTIADFADLWSKLAVRYKANSNVIFGLMNEPFNTELAGTPAGTYPNMIAAWNAAIVAIRAAGAGQVVLAPGSEFTGAHSLVSSGSSTALLNVVDPINNTWIEVHQYLDSDDSGQYAPDSFGAVVNGKGAFALQAATAWARANGKKLFLGEFNAPPTVTGLTELKALFDYMAGNADVWRGWTAWSGSGFDDFYGLKMNPYDSSPSIDRPQWTLARRYIPTATPLPLAISLGAQPVALTGSASSFKVYAEGGLPPYSFSVLSGSLATGYGLTTNNISEGVVSGTPSAAGSFNAVIRVTDAAGATADVSVSTAVTVPGNPNLLSNTQSFDNPAWTKVNATVTPDAIVAPDGTLTADKLVNSAAVFTQCYKGLPNGTLTTGQTHIFSCYAKAAEYTAVVLNVYDNSSDKGVVFDLGTGATSNRPNGGVEGASGVIDVGSGWKRCWFAFTAGASSGGTATISMQNPGTFAAGTFTIGNGLYIWGAKLELASAVSAYPP